MAREGDEVWIPFGLDVPFKLSRQSSKDDILHHTCPCHDLDGRITFRCTEGIVDRSAEFRTAPGRRYTDQLRVSAEALSR